MIGLLHLPLLLVPGLVFWVLALLMHSPASRSRLALGALLVCVATALAEAGVFYAAGAWWGVPGANVMELVVDTVVFVLAFRGLARLTLGRALVGGLAAAGSNWLLASMWSAGLGSAPPR
ncbi:MAG: hypothetical protein ABI609_15945 [Acidobacteriota bacterium]